MPRNGEAFMLRMITLGFLVGFAIPASAQSVTAYEGARLIVGDGRVIENATLVVDGAKISQAGRAADGRKAVQELAAHKVDIVKVWVDTRDGKYKKLTPELYGAIIDEAHQRGLRVTAHIFDLEDAKGLIRAGIDALAHGVRDQDVDD